MNQDEIQSTLEAMEKMALSMDNHFLAEQIRDEMSENKATVSKETMQHLGRMLSFDVYGGAR